MQHERNYVISIAGFDPSAGAGILADIKTFEHIGVYGLGVCTAITVQTEDQLKSVQWIPKQEIISQLQLLLEKYAVQYLKVGIVENLDVLGTILSFLHEQFPQVKVIWDPIIYATAGFEFHHPVDTSTFLDCCRNVFLVTPNATEAKLWMKVNNAHAAASEMSAVTSVFLKSDAGDDGSISDVLFHDNKVWNYRSSIISGIQKHGSGCVLSAAITAFLANGFDLKTSCELAKDYTREFLISAPGLLGEHRNIKITSVHA